LKQQHQDTDLIAALGAYGVLLRDMKGNGRLFSRLRSKVEHLSTKVEQSKHEKYTFERKKYT
jgi:hypothetical protein